MDAEVENTIKKLLGTDSITSEDVKGITSLKGKYQGVFTGDDDIVTLNEFSEFTGLTELEYGEFMSCSALREIKLPETLQSLGDFSFAYCSDLESIVIPNSVQSLGSDCFLECKRLSKIELGSGLTEIGRTAFYGCKSLKQITIPQSVVSIDELAFLECPGLKNGITFEGTNPPKLGREGLGKITEVFVPAGSEQAYKDAWPEYSSFVKEGSSTAVSTETAYDPMYDDMYAGDPISDVENFDKYVSEAKKYNSLFRKLTGDVSYKQKMNRSGDLELQGYGDAMSNYKWILTKQGEVYIEGEKEMGNHFGGVNGAPNPTTFEEFKSALENYYQDSKNYE